MVWLFVHCTTIPVHHMGWGGDGGTDGNAKGTIQIKAGAEWGSCINIKNAAIHIYIYISLQKIMKYLMTFKKVSQTVETFNILSRCIYVYVSCILPYTLYHFQYTTIGYVQVFKI